MATADSTLVIDAETGKAIRELAKLVQSQEHIEKSVQKMGKAQKSAATEMSGVSKAGLSAAKSITGIVSAGAAISTVTALVKGLNDELKQTVNLSDQAAKGTAAFATQIANDPNAANILKDTRVRGAGKGLTPEETGQIANVMKAAGGNLTTDFDTAATLKQIGVSADDAAAIAQMGITRGAGSDVAASKALVATDLAPTDVQTMAKVAPRTRGYQSMEAGLAAAATLSTAGVTDEMLPSSVEAAGRALNKEESALTKKLGLQGLSEAERLRKISAAADASGDREKFLRQMPEKYGLGEEEGRALQAILGEGEKYHESEAALRATGGGELEGRHQRLREIDPMYAQAEDARIAAETSKMNDIYGPTAPAAQDYRAYKQGVGLGLQNEHPYLSKVPGMVDEQTGEAQLGGMAYDQWRRGNVPMPTPVPGVSVPGGWGGGDERSPKQARDDEIKKALDRNSSALEANTEATKQNSDSTGGGTPQRNANL